jgi:hypothetical protein
MESLVSFLMQEGHESYLWAWIKQDQPLGDAEQRLSPKIRDNPHHAYKGRKLEFARYRWRANILAAMVKYLTEQPTVANFNSAMDVCLKAFELRDSMAGGGDGYLERWPLAQPAVRLEKAIWSHLKNGSILDIDPKRFERYHAFLATGDIGASEAHRLAAVGSLCLCHPVKPSCDDLLHLLRGVDARNITGWRSLGATLSDPLTRDAENGWYSKLTYTAALLRLSARKDDETWIESFAMQHWPQRRQHWETHVANAIRTYENLDARVKAREGQAARVGGKIERVLFPTFA